MESNLKEKEEFSYSHVKSGMTQTRRHPSEQHFDSPLQSRSVAHSSLRSSEAGGHRSGSRIFVGHLPVDFKPTVFVFRHNVREKNDHVIRRENENNNNNNNNNKRQRCLAV